MILKSYIKTELRFFAGIDVKEKSASEECDICHFSYFLNTGFKFSPNVCNKYHDLLMISMNVSDLKL